MKTDDVIHLRLDYEDALESKKNILYSEKSLINIIKKIDNYLYLREEEQKAKEKLRKRIKSTISIIKKTQKIFPKVKIPKILNKEISKKEFDRKISKKIFEKEKISKYGSNIDSQLREIQEKLNAIQK